ncbi:MAG: glycosyltransferase family 4 protein [Ferrovibrio sp.]|nr:glycosyltransferase family 4 protein [Ferrovibrio sp.]
MSESQPSAASRPPAVLQVIPALVTGGVERGTVDLARALVQAGWKSYVASEGGPMVRELERAGAQHFTLPLASKNPLVMRKNVDRLETLIRDLPVDLVHARSRAPAWSARAAARACGLPFVTTFHNAYKADNWLKKLWNSSMAKGDRVIAISDFVANYAHSRYGVPWTRLTTIPRGVDLAKFDPARVSPERITQLSRAWRLEDGLPVILLPGRLTRWKGQGVLLKALAKLAELRGGKRDFIGVVVGDHQGREAYRNELFQLAAQLGLEGSLRLPGDTRDMPAALMLADVVVSASIEPEGFGRIAVEAQAMGRPVIATNHGGARETVLPGETGWLVAPNHPAELAAALNEAISMTPAQRQAMSRQAMAHVAAHFTVDAMCASYIQVYTELLFGREAAA